MLDDQIKALAQRAGETTKILDTTLSASISTLNDHEARIQNALQKTTADGSTQTVTTPVNFTGVLNSAGVAVVTTSGSQSLSNKVLNGFRPATATWTSGGTGTIAASSPMNFVTTSSALVLTLPTVLAGVTVVVKNAVGVTVDITIQRAGSTAMIDGAASIKLTAPYSFVQLTSTASNWFITGKG